MTMTLVEKMAQKIMDEMRKQDAQPELEKTYPERAPEYPRLILVFRPFRSSRKDKFLATDQNLRITVEKLKDGLWRGSYEDLESGAIIAQEHIQANAPDLAQLEAYQALKSSLPVLKDLNGYWTRLENASVTFTDPQGNAQD